MATKLKDVKLGRVGVILGAPMVLAFGYNLNQEMISNAAPAAPSTFWSEDMVRSIIPAMGDTVLDLIQPIVQGLGWVVDKIPTGDKTTQGAPAANEYTAIGPEFLPASHNTIISIGQIGLAGQELSLPPAGQTYDLAMLASV